MIVQSPKSRVRFHLTTSSSAPVRQAETARGHLQDELREALRATGYFINLQNEITVDITSSGHVLLRGVVPSYYHKQKAQVAAMSVNGVRSLQNDLVVVK